MSTNLELKELFRQQHSHIVKAVRFQDIKDHLIQEGLLRDINDQQEVEMQPTEKDKISYILLNLLPYRHSDRFKEGDAYERFLLVLEKCEYDLLAKQIRGGLCIPSAAKSDVGRNIPSYCPAMTTAFRCICSNSIALTQWKDIARRLGLAEHCISDIEHKHRHEGLSEKLNAVLQNWKTSSSEPTIEALSTCLRSGSYVRLAEDIEAIKKQDSSN